MSVLRQRRKPVVQIVTELDAFPKVPETYVEQTVTGAYGINFFQILQYFYIILLVVAIITFVLVVLMLYSELNYYFLPALKFRFAPDTDMNAKLKFNVDMTVAMPCHCKYSVNTLITRCNHDKITVIGADILDKTDQNAFTFGRLKQEPIWWELDPTQRIHFDEV